MDEIDWHVVRSNSEILYGRSTYNCKFYDLEVYVSTMYVESRSERGGFFVIKY